MADHEGHPETASGKSIIARLQAEYPDTNLAFAAAWYLTSEPLEVRKTFLEEFAAHIAENSDDPAVRADAYKIAVGEVIYAGGYTGEGQKYIDAWREAAPEGEHPHFGIRMPESNNEALRWREEHQ